MNGIDCGKARLAQAYWNFPAVVGFSGSIRTSGAYSGHLKKLVKNYYVSNQGLAHSR